MGNLLEREGEKEMKNKNKTLQFCKMQKKKLKFPVKFLLNEMEIIFLKN